jgi:hypothetical protein
VASALRPTSGGGVNVARILDTFPGAVPVMSAEPSDAERRLAAEVYCRTLWGERVGYVAAPRLEAGHMVDGRYKGRWQEGKCWRWPDDAEAFLDWAVAASATADVYVAPMLRLRPKRAKETGKEARYAWADVDRWTATASAKWDQLRQLGHGPSFAIDSGRGRHLYLDLTYWLPVEQVERWNRRLASHLGGDVKWSNEAVLRLPGSFSHKSRCTCPKGQGGSCALSGPSRPVRWTP